MRYNFGHGARALIVEGLRLAGRAVDVARLEAMTLRFLDVYAGRMAVETRPYPGSEAALDRLAARGWRMAVCAPRRSGSRGEPREQPSGASQASSSSIV